MYCYMYQETVNIIKVVGTLLNLIIDHPNITLLSKQFNEFKSEKKVA